MEALRATGDAEAVAIVGTFGDPIEVEGEQGFVLALDTVEGDVTPPIVDGRAPRGENEIVLGSRLMNAAGADVGDSVAVSVPGVGTADMRVVGPGVLPPLNEADRFGEGALVSLATFRELEPDEEGDVGLLVRHVEGVNESELRGDLERELERRCAEGVEDVDLGCELGTDVSVQDINEPDPFVNFGGAQRTPLVIDGILAALAAGTLAYVLTSVVRRRRRDLAVLKTLGFDRRGIRRIVAWQATTLTLAALGIGLPPASSSDAGRGRCSLGTSASSWFRRCRSPSAALIVPAASAARPRHRRAAGPSRRPDAPAVALRTE